MIGPFVLTFLFVLTLASDMAVLYESDAFSILVLSTKKWYWNGKNGIEILHQRQNG